MLVLGFSVVFGGSVLVEKVSVWLLMLVVCSVNCIGLFWCIVWLGMFVSIGGVLIWLMMIVIDCVMVLMLLLMVKFRLWYLLVVL